MAKQLNTINASDKARPPAGSFRYVQWVPGILLALIKRERATSKSWMFVYKPIAGRQLSQNVGWLRFVHVITKFLKISDKERDSNRKFWNLGLSVKFEMPWVVLWPDNTQQCHKQKTRRESEATTAASEESEVRIVQQQITPLNTRYFTCRVISITARLGLSKLNFD